MMNGSARIQSAAGSVRSPFTASRTRRITLMAPKMMPRTFTRRFIIVWSRIMSIS